MFAERFPVFVLQFWFISIRQCLPMPGGGYHYTSPSTPGLQWQQSRFRAQNRFQVENSSPDSEWVDHRLEEKVNKPRESSPFHPESSSPDSPWSPDYVDNLRYKTEYHPQYKQTNNNVEKAKFERFSPDWPGPVETSSHQGKKLISNIKADYIVATDVDTYDLLQSIANVLDTDNGELKEDEQSNEVVPHIVVSATSSASPVAVDHCSDEKSYPCGSNTTCQSTPTGPACSCLPGFVLDGKSGLCLDEDECSSLQSMCGDSRSCTNTVGSYVCVCREGFREEGDLSECADVDECVEDDSLCTGPGSVCRNTEGGYECQCREGFVLNKDSEECEDVNECLEEDDICEENAVCVNSEGSYSCQCKPGYSSARPGSGAVEGCRDVDECLGHPDLCGEHGICYNVEGSYLCRCRMGFYRDDATNTCEDINECLDEVSDVCSDNSDCVNTSGSFTCQCRSGYSGDPALGCQDDDECSLIPPPCGEMAECQNTPGSFSCSCMEGFEGNPPSVPCSPNREVADSLPTLTRTKCMKDMDCLPDSHCKEGECRCKDGYTEAGSLCVDKDECELVPGICHTNSVCRNLAGGYLCSCKEGFARYPPSYGCSQVNRCRRECGDKAECRLGEEGEYLCVCDEGYVELLGGGCVEE